MRRASTCREIIHLAHHAAADPKLWTEVCLRLSERLQAPLIAFVEHNYMTLQGGIRHAAGVDERFHGLYATRFATRNVWLHMKRRFEPGEVMTGAELVPNWDLVRTDFYRSWLRPQRAFHCLLGITFRCDEEIRCLMALRPLESPAFQAKDKQRLRVLLPDLRCACELYAHVAAHRRNTEIFVDLMAALPEALLVVDGEGCPIFLNALAEQLIARHDGLALTHGRLVAASPTEAGELRKLIAEAAARASGSAGGHGAEIAITRPSGGPSLVLRIAPIPHPAMDHVGREKLVVAILVHWAEPAEAVGRFCHAHRLTPAEGRLAALILNGHSLLDAAAELHITKNTARTHMKRIYAKTETHRQTDLIRLVADGGLHFH